MSYARPEFDHHQDQLLNDFHETASPVWVSHDGTARLPHMMNDQHLINAIALTERQYAPIVRGSGLAALYDGLLFEVRRRHLGQWLKDARERDMRKGLRPDLRQAWKLATFGGHYGAGWNFTQQSRLSEQQTRHLALRFREAWPELQLEGAMVSPTEGLYNIKLSWKNNGAK